MVDGMVGEKEVFGMVERWGLLLEKCTWRTVRAAREIEDLNF